MRVRLSPLGVRWSKICRLSVSDRETMVAALHAIPVRLVVAFDVFVGT